jgi:hypothetical protein
VSTEAPANASHRWPAITAVVCLVLAIALSIAATRLDPFPFDVPIILIVQAPDSAVLDGLARGLSWIGRSSRWR